ncbi:MAG: hypothetical protein U1E04_17470 [Hylemonella sp.]|nr:hypothetical protein [Hylemonella sp.]
MSLISRVEISNYLTEGLETNHFANWNPMLTGITLRMDCQSSLVNITNGGGKTSMAELLLLVLSRDKSLLQRVRDKSAPKGRGYTHARIEFREVDKSAYREPSLLEVDPENLPGQTRVVGVALNNDVADAPIFYSYSGTLEDSPCYTLVNGVLNNVPDEAFVKKTKSIPGCQWNTFRNASEWQAHVGDAISMDVVRRNAIYQNKGSDDKNASFFSFKPRAGDSYDAAFFKFVVAPDLLTNLLNTFAEEDETSVEDTLHSSLSQIVTSEREMARKQENLERRETAIGVELKPVVDAGTTANKTREAMQTALRVVKKDVALLQHYGSQDSPHAVLGLPRSVDKLVRSTEQDPRIRKALKGMVIHREDGILILDKTLGELAGIEVKRIGEISDRKHIPNSPLNSQVIDFACDFGFSTSGKAGGGHYRKGYTREAVAKLLPLFADTSGATLMGLDDVFQAAFDTAQAQIDTNPASLKIYALKSTLTANVATLQTLNKEIEQLGTEIAGLRTQIQGRAENEAAWNKFLNIAPHLPQELHNQPRQAKEWLAKEVATISTQMNEMSSRKGELKSGWERYLKAIDEAGLSGIEGIRTQYIELTEQKKKLGNQYERAKKKADESAKKRPDLERAVIRAEQLVRDSSDKVDKLNELKAFYAVFQSYFGEVDPRDVEHPSTTLRAVTTKKSNADADLARASNDYAELVKFKASAGRFIDIFGSDCDALTADPIKEHRDWSEAQSLAQQNMQPLEPLVTALEGFRVKYPDQTPSQWIDATDKRRTELTDQLRITNDLLDTTDAEIEALDNLSVVDDAAFSRAWAVLGDGPQRLYAMLQTMEGTPERRIGALSALTGLLSAPVFETLEDLSAAAAVLEQQDIGIPLLLKAPLLQAIGTQGQISGDLQVMGFFAGRYSRQARILLDPAFAKEQRALLVSRQVGLTKRIEALEQELKTVDYRTDEYRMATQAGEAIKTGSEAKYAAYEAEFNLARQALHRLTPQIKDDALACLAAQRNYLQKGGEARQGELETECVVFREKADAIAIEFDTAEKRACEESLNAYTDAKRYANLGGDEALVKANHTLEQANAAHEAAKLEVETHTEAQQELESAVTDAESRATAFEQDNSPDRIEELRLVVEFSKQADDIAFMEGYKSAHEIAAGRSTQFIEFQSNVNFDRAASYFENLGKSEADLASTVANKLSDQGEKQKLADGLVEANKLIEGAEIPSWLALRKSIHDLAYELGSQAAATKAAHADFSLLEEGQYPVASHTLYTSLQQVADRLRAPTLEETNALASLVSEVQFSIQSIDLQSSLDTFNKMQETFRTATSDYAAKKQVFCNKAELESGTKTAAFNALELDVIKRATPEQISELNALFERLNVSLGKDREDAAKAIHAAQAANEEALKQLSSLILVAQDNLEAMDKVMGRYPSGCFKIKVQLAGEDLINEILMELTAGVKLLSENAGEGTRALRRTNESRIKDFLRETLIDKIFLEPKVNFIHSGIRATESPVTEKLSTGQKVALEFMWIVRQAEYEIERGMRKLSNRQAARKRQETNRVIFVDGIFSTLSDRHIIREAFNGLGNLGGNFQIIGFLHSPTWTNDSSVFPVYHVGKKLTNNSGERLVKFTESGRSPGTVGFFSSITRPHVPAT